MKKPIKYWLIAMAVLLGLGLVLTFVGGVILHGDIWRARQMMHWGPLNVWGPRYHYYSYRDYDRDWDWDWDREDDWGHGHDRQVALDNMSEVTGLELDMAGVEEIYLEYGDDFDLRTEDCATTPESRVEHGVWKLEQREYRRGGRVWITIPRELVLETADLGLAGGQLIAKDIAITDLDVDMAAGNMELDNVQCRRLDVEMAAGELNLNGDVLEKADLSLAAGKLKLTMPRPQQYEYDVAGSVGSVTVDGHQLTGFGSQSGGPGGGTRFDIECIAGTVEIEFEENV